MGGKGGEIRHDMLPKIEKTLVCKLKRNGLKRNVCRLKRNRLKRKVCILKRNGGSITF